MRSKKGFTIIELVMVLLILGIIISITRTFLNTTRQEKLVFGENCINYVFGQVEKIQSDIEFERNNKLLLTGNITPTHFVFEFKGRRTTTVGSGEVNVYGLIYDHDAGGITSQKLYEKLTLTFGNIPTACKSSRFGVVISEQDSFGNPLNVVIPTEEADPDTNWYIGTNSAGFLNGTVTSSDPTGEALFHVCDISSPGNIKNCIQVAKIYADKRSKKFFFWKCLKTSSTTDGICQVRPKIR